MKVMKRIALILSLAALALSCNNGGDASKPGRKVGEIYVTAQSGAKSVLVELAGLWRVIPQENWMSVDVNGREGEGAFTVYYSSNESDFVNTNSTRRGAIVIRSLKSMVSDTLYIIQQGTPDGIEYTSAPQDSYIEFEDVTLTRIKVLYANLKGASDPQEVSDWIQSSDANVFCLSWDADFVSRLASILFEKSADVGYNGNFIIVNRSDKPATSWSILEYPAAFMREIDGVCYQISEFDRAATALSQISSLLDGGYNQPYANSKWVIGGSFYYLSVMEMGYPGTPDWYPANPSDEVFLADTYAQTNNLTDCIWMSHRQFNPTWSEDGKSWRADYIYASNKMWNAAVDARLLDATVSGASHKAVQLTVKY